MASELDLHHALNTLTKELRIISKSTTDNLQDLKEEVAELKDSRLKPYMTSMGLFLVITIGVMSYVYQMETKFTSAMFTLNDRIQESSGIGLRNSDRYEVIDERLKARSRRTSDFIDSTNKRIASIEMELRKRPVDGNAK